MTYKFRHLYNHSLKIEFFAHTLEEAMQTLDSIVSCPKDYKLIDLPIPSTHEYFYTYIPNNKVTLSIECDSGEEADDILFDVTFCEQDWELFGGFIRK